MIEFLFAFIVTAAVIAVLFEPKRGGLIVMAIAMMAAFWQLALIVGPSPWLAIFAVFVAAAVKIIDELSGEQMLGNVSLVRVADAVLTRLQGAPPPRRRGGGGGGGEQQGQGQRRPPEVFRDQDEDD